MRRGPAIAVIAAAAALVLIAVTIVLVVLIRPEPVPSQDPRLEPEALTPEEITIEVTPESDGSLHITERLVFDATGNEDEPLSWAIGVETIGWTPDPSDTRYVVRPAVVGVRAVELGTGAESTRRSPVEVGELDVTRDESGIEDPFFDDALFTFSPPGGPEAQWTPGRHVVEIRYVLAEVFLHITGQDLFVLPLSFPDGSSEAVSIRTVEVMAGGPILCLPENVDFSPDPDCSGLREHRMSEEGTSLTWRQRPGSSIAAIGFTPPKGLGAEPQTVHEREG